ncbi:MAG: helix-turn-helix domain-containing protein [Candidatus Sungbacteria bacterium]|uniref:Helix-turn-helix domain-containing protein n=1 Tax=Candidatus Sungiibacteriota bacterium TaxID=2750080 RepID=A0A932YXW3_9BACT|nr:helix-turn-helix domain-containing protein [Candidatus Sungbacteria bacterium]
MARWPQPPKTPEVWQEEFRRIYGRGSVERFIERCRGGILLDAAGGFGMRSPAEAWHWYCRLTGERRKPRRPREKATLPGEKEARRRGRPPGIPGAPKRPDVTPGQVRALVDGRMKKSDIARWLGVSRQTVYQRLRP